MGEYATLGGQRVKIGTCEEMFYLRHNQRHLVKAESGNVNVADLAIAAELRFRFPWPDEDGVEVGAFDPFERAVAIDGLTVPPDVEHCAIQFTASAGYLLSLPCPESTAFPAGLRFHRNGFAGAVQLVQQKPTLDGRTLRAIFRCGGCGAKWRADTWAEVEPAVVALRSMADAENRRAAWWHEIADRLAAGYPDATQVLAV